MNGILFWNITGFSVTYMYLLSFVKGKRPKMYKKNNNKKKTDTGLAILWQARFFPVATQGTTA